MECITTEKCLSAERGLEICFFVQEKQNVMTNFPQVVSGFSTSIIVLQDISTNPAGVSKTVQCTC
jgi:hypothetical protein